MKPLPQFTEEALLAITVAVLALLVYLTFPFAAAGVCLTNPNTGAHRGTQATRATVAVDPQTHAPQPNPAAASFFYATPPGHSVLVPVRPCAFR